MTETQTETQTEKDQSREVQEEKTDPQQQVIELTELLKRTQANFENYRKQSEKRMEDLREMASKQVILQLLPVLDHLQLALKHAEMHKDAKEFVEGIGLVASQFVEILRRNGVEEIFTEKQKLNPHLHEAIGKVESELPENSVVEEVQKGYTLHGQVIRHAKVKMSSGKNYKDQENKSQ